MDGTRHAAGALKVRDGMVICMSRPTSGAEAWEGGVVFKHSTRFCNGWWLIAFHVHLKEGRTGDSIVKGMKGKLIFLFMKSTFSTNIRLFFYSTSCGTERGKRDGGE